MSFPARLILSADIGSGQVQSTALGSGAIVSGQLGSGAIAPNAMGVAPSSYLTGNFSYSGVCAGTSGVVIVSGAFTPRSTGILLVGGEAQFFAASGLFYNVAIGSGLAILTASGLGTPSSQGFGSWGGVSFPNQFSQLVKTTAAVGAAQNFSIVMQPTASGLISGAGSLLIQEILV